jgi:hypothetical protein
VFDTLTADDDGLYDPRDPNDWLVLGLKGTLFAAEVIRTLPTARQLLRERQWAYSQLWDAFATANSGSGDSKRARPYDRGPEMRLANDESIWLQSNHTDMPPAAVGCHGKGTSKYA